jgi:hypothetical protein
VPSANGMGIQERVELQYTDLTVVESNATSSSWSARMDSLFGSQFALPERCSFKSET